MAYDAQLQNKSERGAQLYSDLDLFFGKNNTDKDINIIYDVQAVKRSIRNLVLLNQYEKPFHPEIFSGVRGMLFELITPVNAVTVEFYIVNAPTELVDLTLILERLR